MWIAHRLTRFGQSSAIARLAKPAKEKPFHRSCRPQPGSHREALRRSEPGWNEPRCETGIWTRTSLKIRGPRVPWRKKTGRQLDQPKPHLQSVTQSAGRSSSRRSRGAWEGNPQVVRRSSFRTTLPIVGQSGPSWLRLPLRFGFRSTLSPSFLLPVHALVITSVALLNQIRATDQVRLLRRLGVVDRDTFERVEEDIQISLVPL
jgi:hypothetical protein